MTEGTDKKKTPTRRARKPEDKIKRSNKILQMAWKMYDESGGLFPAVSDIADRVGLAKGTVYIYFSSREEIFLEIFLLKLEEWADSFLSKLKNVKSSSVSVQQVAKLITKYPLNSESYLKLASTIKSIVEANSNDEAVLQSRIRIAKLRNNTAKELSMAFKDIPKNKFDTLFMELHALIIGLYQTYSISDEIQQRLQERNIKLFNKEFSRVVNDAVISHLKGVLD